MVGLSRIPGSRLRLCRLSVPELDAPRLPAASILSDSIRESLPPAAFLRELFESIELPIPCQAESLLTDSIPLKGVAQRINSQRATGKMPALHMSARKILFRVMQWLFSLGIPYRDRGILPPSPDPTNRLPRSPLRAGPEGPQEAPLLICNFQRVTHVTQCCKRLIHLSFTALPPRCNFLRIATSH
jgi:hypothetical protein